MDSCRLDFHGRQQQQTQHKLHRPTMQANQQSPAKLAPGSHNASAESCRVQRKLFSFFYIYAILIVTLYVTYAAYYFYQHHQSRQQQQQQQQQRQDQQSATVDTLLPSASQLEQQQPNEASVAISEAKLESWKQELEAKFKFVEKYVEILTIELQDTQRRLREREKCDCSTSCTFNGTRYADRSSWQNQCDTCTCQSGKISCQPQKCPQVSCDDPVQLVGQCCPVCMKRCKYNATVIRHGQKFSPPETNKECKCQDGHIKCEQRKSAGAIRAAAAAAAKVVGSPKPASEAIKKTKGSDKQQHPKAADAIVANKTIPTTSKDTNGDRPTQMTSAEASDHTTSASRRRDDGEKSGPLIGAAKSVASKPVEAQLSSGSARERH